MVFSECWAGKVVCLMLCACLLFLPQHITELMTRPFLKHFFTSPSVTFHLIFSCQFPCISKEGVTPLLALWSVWSDRKQAQVKHFWGISDKPTYHWNLCSEKLLSLFCFPECSETTVMGCFGFSASTLQLKLWLDNCSAVKHPETPHLYSAISFLWIVVSPSTPFQCVGSQIPF